MGGLLGTAGEEEGSAGVLHTSCRTLCDVFDVCQLLGLAAGAPDAAASLLERLQARVRRIAGAAAAAGMGRLSLAERPRVLVLSLLQPTMVEPGRCAGGGVELCVGFFLGGG